jgi:hypothetical protein
MTLDKENLSQKMPWIITIVIFTLATVFQAGYAVATYATKTELQGEVKAARQERMDMIEKAMDDHKIDQRADMDRIYKKLESIEAALNRSLLIRR